MSTPIRRRPANFLPVVALLFFLALALVVTYPLVTVLGSRFAGHPFSDSYELARHIWWLAHALRTGQPLFDAPLLAYPDGLSGALLWAYPLQSWPAALFALVLPLPAAFNLSLLLRLALNGWSVWLLARRLTDSNAAALVAGTIFLTYPTFQTHLAAGHTGLLALWPFVLYADALLRLRAAPERRWVVAAAVLFMMSSWGSTQLLVLTTAPLTLAVALTLLVERNRAAFVRLVVAAGVGALLALIFALPLLLDALAEPAWVRLQTGVVDYSADLLTVLAPSFLHPLTGDNPLSGRILGVDPFEATAYVGVVAALLALVGLWRRAARWWLALGLVVWVASLGPLLRVGGAPLRLTLSGYDTSVVLPWAALYDLPLINITRTPVRFNFLIGLVVALTAAYGVQALLARAPRRWGTVAALALAALVTFDAQFWWQAGAPVPDFPTIDGVVPAEIAALAGRDDVRAVLDLPWAHPLAAKEGLWLQTGHEHPLVAGHMTRQTPVDPAKLTLLETMLDPALLDAAGADIVIIHREWDNIDGLLEARAHDRLGEPIYRDDRFLVFATPPSDAAPAFTALPSTDVVLTDTTHTYVYTPDALEARLVGRVDGANRLVTVLLDEREVDAFRASGEMPLDVPLPLTPGYHRVELRVTPACPPVANATLACRDVAVNGLQIVAPAAEP